MKIFLSLTFLLAVLLIVAWSVFFDALGFPIGTLMVLPLLFFSWRETFAYTLLLTLLWESTTPLPFGQVAVPLTCAVLLVQMLFRHQLRANLITHAFTAVVLQCLAFLSFGRLCPPQSFLNALLQLFQTLGSLFWAVVIGALWLLFLRRLGERRFSVNLEHRLKDL